MKSYIGLIYFIICFARTTILFTILEFPIWIYFICILIPFAVPMITALIEDSIYRKENYDEDTIIIEIKH